MPVALDIVGGVLTTGMLTKVCLRLGFSGTFSSALRWTKTQWGVDI